MRLPCQADCQGRRCVMGTKRVRAASTGRAARMHQCSRSQAEKKRRRKPKQTKHKRMTRGASEETEELSQAGSRESEVKLRGLEEEALRCSPQRRGRPAMSIERASVARARASPAPPALSDESAGRTCAIFGLFAAKWTTHRSSPPASVSYRAEMSEMFATRSLDRGASAHCARPNRPSCGASA